MHMLLSFILISLEFRSVLTATATPPVQAKLLSLLINPVREIASVNKPNVAYIVKQLRPLPKGTNHTLASSALLYKCTQ